MSVEIIHDFLYSAGSIFELKFHDATNKKDRYQWYLISEGGRYELEFISQSESTRELRIGGTDVHLDMARMELTLGDPHLRFPIRERS